MQKFIFALLTTISITANATSVIQYNIEEIAGKSGLVFQGKVVGINSYQEASGAIYTVVEFDVQDVVKGSHPSDTVTLRYMGGTANGLTMNVVDSNVPTFGQTGIYFVAKDHHELAHPLTGWGQGHYLIESTASGYRVFNSQGKAVTGIRTNKKSTAIRHAFSAHTAPLNSHEAAGLLLSDKSRNAITPSDFKQRILSYSK